jgi:HEAT repeat protein
VVEYPGESWKQEQLHEALKSKDIMMKMGAIRVLQETPKDEFIASLMDAMNDTDRLVRINAAITLGKAKNPLAIPILVYHAVSDQDKDVKLYSSWAYRQIDYAKASPQLVNVLIESSSGPDMVRFAANEIRQKNDSKAIDALIQHFQSKGMYTGYDLDMPAVNGLYEVGYATVEPLVKCLDNDDTRVQANAIYTLGKIGDERAIQPLINHLAAATIELRSRISDALIKIGRSSIPALVKLLDNKDRELKWIGAYCLAQIGPDAEAALLNTLKQRGPMASEEIIYALGIAGRNDSFGPLYNIYLSTPDDSVKAWSTIALASILSSNYGRIPDRVSADKFMKELGDQLKPHMLLSSEALLSLGNIYILNGVTSDVNAFKLNIGLGIKCYDLSIIEKENASARAYRLFYGSYLKLMTSKSSEIMNYIERDVTDLKKDAERSSSKKELVFLMDRLLKILQGAYEDRGFDFIGNFPDFLRYCGQMAPFLEGFYEGEESRKPAGKEQTTLHADIGMIQDRLDNLLKVLGEANDAESVAFAYRLSTDIARLDTGLYDDYRIIELCLKSIVGRLQLSNEEKADLQFKTLLISKNGVSQIQLVLDQMLRSLKFAPVEKPRPQPDQVKKASPRISTLEYVVIAIIVILLIVVIIVGLNKAAVIKLPFSMPISWLNPSLGEWLAGIS